MIPTKIKVLMNDTELLWLKQMVETAITDPDRPAFKEQLLCMLVLRGLAERLHGMTYHMTGDRNVSFKDTEAVALVLAYTRGWLSYDGHGPRLMILRVTGVLDQKTQ